MAQHQLHRPHLRHHHIHLSHLLVVLPHEDAPVHHCTTKQKNSGSNIFSFYCRYFVHLHASHLSKVCLLILVFYFFSITPFLLHVHFFFLCSRKEKNCFYS